MVVDRQRRASNGNGSRAVALTDSSPDGKGIAGPIGSPQCAGGEKLPSRVRLGLSRVGAAHGELIGTHMGEIHKDQLDELAGVLGQLDRGERDRDSVRETLNAL